MYQIEDRLNTVNKTKKLIKIMNTISCINIAIIIAIIIYSHYQYVSEIFTFSVATPMILIVLVMRVIIQKRLKQESKLKVNLTSEQYEKISEKAKEQNKSVNQFCIDAINEKLDKRL